MSAAQPARPANAGDRFQLLDLLRGIAAIAVLIYHGENYLGVQFLPNAYLAVDIFFLLSGFVIAHNYDKKIARGMSLQDFFVQRLIRLYPCFVLTFALGFLLTAARLIRDYGYTDGWRLFAAGSLNALFLPALVQPYQRADFFPFNGAAWSLTFELFANLIYWLLFRYLSARTLGIIIGGSAVALTIVGYMAGTIDIGMRPQDFLLGIPRVLFPFFVGVALRRYALERITFKAGEISVAAGVVVLLTTFSWSHLVSKNHLVIAELATLFVVFPGLLAALCKVIPGPRLATVCKLTGDASYPVYLLQTPFVMLFAAIPQVFFHTKAQAWVPYIGIAHISATLLCALWVDRYFELPVRNMLKTRWIAFQKRKQVGAAVPQPAEAP